eukprot:768588-Hanusia_phi.AAC.2
MIPGTVDLVDKEVKNGKVVFVHAYLPWCNMCAYTRQGFIRAAKELGGNQTNNLFVHIDVREDKAAAKRYNVSSCAPECFFIIARNGENDEVMAAKGSDEDIASGIRARVSPALTKVATEAEVNEFVKDNAVAVLVAVKGGLMSKATDSSEYVAAKAAAQTLRGKANFMYTDKKLLGLAQGNMRVWVNGSNPQTASLSSDSMMLAKQVIGLSWGLELFNYTWKKREVFDSVNIPVAHVFPGSKPEDLEMFKEVARELSGKIAFLRFSEAENYMLKDFGLMENKYPAFGIAESFDAKAKRFAFEGESFAKDKILEFCKNFLEGKLEPSYKSEAIPEGDHVKGTVRQVVWKTLIESKWNEITAKEDVILLLYKPWSSDNQKVQTTFDKVAAALEKVEGVSLGKIDSSKNHYDTERFPVDEYSSEPAVFLCKAGAKPQRFTGSFTQKDLFKFLAKNVPAVKAGWESLVKPKLQEIKAAEEEKKRKAEEAAAAEKAKLEEEKKKIDELVATAEKIDVGSKKNGGLIKQIISAGTGDATPQKGDLIKAHYTGTLLDGSKFDSSRDRGDPFSFTIGQGQVIPCWDEAFLTMKKGERALLTCTAENAYGERGAGEKIPPGATLRFDVELIEFGSKAKSEL